jgi:putative transposase
VRYFTDGAVIGSREFVNAAFDAARKRFGPKRKDGARKLRGSGSAAAGLLWSLRDLQKPPSLKPGGIDISANPRNH